MALDPTQQSAVAWIEANRARLSDFNKTIWHFAEPAWREYKSSRAYWVLRAEVFGRGRFGRSDCLCCYLGQRLAGSGQLRRYDGASPVSRSCRTSTARGLHPWTAGHTDPAFVIGSAAVAGILAARRRCKHGLRGTLGSSASRPKNIAARNGYAAKGYYDGCDAFIAYHRTPPTRCRARPSAARIGASCHLRTCRQTVDRQVAAADPHIGPCCGALPRRDRRAVPDVYDHQVHQRGDVSARRRLDAQRIHPGRRRRDIGQPGAAVQPDPVFVAVADVGNSTADLSGAGQQRPPRRDMRLPGFGPVGSKTRVGAAEQHHGRSGVSQYGGDQRAPAFVTGTAI